MDMPLNTILEKYKIILQKFNKNLKVNYEFVFNEENISRDSSKIKAIIVMDNPGREEKDQKKYLVGNAGKAFNKVFKLIGIKREEILIFNKSSISTPATGDLNKIYLHNDLKKLFIEEQEITAKTIFEIRNLLNVPLLIHGYASYLKGEKIFIENEKSNRPLYIFFKELKMERNAKEFTYFYKHSSYGNLSKQVSKYMREYNLETLSFEHYLDLGKQNSENFFK